MPPRPNPGYSSGEYDVPDVPDYVIAQLDDSSRVAFPPRATAFAAPAAAAPTRDSLNAILSTFQVKKIGPLFNLAKAEFTRRMAEILPSSASISPDSDYSLVGFVRVELDNPKQCVRLVNKLKQAPGVREAYIAPRPKPAAKAVANVMPVGAAPGSRNFEPSQGYLHDPPNGIGACAAWKRPGGTGTGVTICDVEGDWQLKHEDLPQGIKLIGGKVIGQLDWRDHGTAVLGEMVSLPNNIGCVGISHGASAVVHSVMINGAWNVAGAIAGATAILKAGDVILIEQHARGGPNNNWLAMQFWPAEFAAIQIAVAKGIVVVEAAGNGDEDFDAPAFVGTGLQKDAGAIVVGAGVPPTNYFDAYGAGAASPPYSLIGAPRSRIWFSNYGQIVNVQGWGWHVTTLGYGDAQGGRSERVWYTIRFSGTSSASPIVAGAVACLQGFAKAQIKRPLTPKEVRDILISTGTPQEDDAPRAPLAQKIGPQPNLKAALDEVVKRFGGQP